jgi:hypothetical protein
MLATHGPVVAGLELDAARNAIEESEASPDRPCCCAAPPPMLSPEQVPGLVRIPDIALGD